MDFDSSESIWKLDGPIGRWDFFKITIILLLLSLAVIFGSALLRNTPGVVLVIPAWLVIGYLTIVATIKRLWDVMGSRTSGIVCFIIAAVISGFVPFSGLAIDIILFLVPGQCTLGE